MSHHTATLTIQRPEGKGTTSPKTGKKTYRVGATVRITATPTRSYRLSHWLIDNVLTANNNPYMIIMSVNHTVKAFFVKGYTVDITIEGAGTVTKLPDKPLYETGEVVTLTAVPIPGNIFKGWTDNGAVKPTVPLVITV